ncbi:hypothetical protein B7463_g12494, partial [Scytalidium lignicola]
MSDKTPEPVVKEKTLFITPQPDSPTASVRARRARHRQTPFLPSSSPDISSIERVFDDMKRQSERLAAKNGESSSAESPTAARRGRRAKEASLDEDASYVPDAKETLSSAKKRKRGKQSEDLKARKRKEYYKARREDGADSSSEGDDDIPAISTPTKGKGKGKGKEKAITKSHSENGETIPDQEEYQVEAIVDSKLKDGKRHYLVKWAGYPKSENTWEPESHLTKVRAMIKQFRRDNLET